MYLNPAKPPYPKREKGPLVLERSELSLEAGALPVELLVPLRFVGDEGVQPVGSIAAMTLAARTIRARRWGASYVGSRRHSRASPAVPTHAARSG